MRTFAVPPAPQRRRFGGPLLALAGTLCLLPLASWAHSELEARYPYDPACPWGRLSNGKGVLERCLTEAEARALAEPHLQPAPAEATKTETSSPEPAEPKQSEPETPEESAPTTPQKLVPLSIQVGPIKADQGKITVGKLGRPLDRYEQCVQKNGGLTGKQGKVTVQFLVRAEFLRAEGVEVKQAQGVSPEAARCIADVVDRRQVGAPTVPMTAAELQFTIQPKK